MMNRISIFLTKNGLKIKGKNMIKLVNDTIDNNDVDSLVEWLKTYPRLTKGELTPKLEEKWSKWLGTDYTVFCNSGSSANLLMLWALVEAGRKVTPKIGQLLLGIGKQSKEKAKEQLSGQGFDTINHKIL